MLKRVRGLVEDELVLHLARFRGPGVTNQNNITESELYPDFSAFHLDGVSATEAV